LPILLDQDQYPGAADRLRWEQALQGHQFKAYVVDENQRPNALRETTLRGTQFFTRPGLRKLMNIIERILDLLKTHDKMAIATLRGDGFPHATTVNYVNEGLVIYFGCGARSQKTRNIVRDERVSLAIDHEYVDWSKIQGLSIGGIAERVSDVQDIERIGELFTQKFPQLSGFRPEDLLGTAFFRVTPKVISVIDYTKGFGHSELVELG
jgi:general stress protein 26